MSFHFILEAQLMVLHLARIRTAHLSIFSDKTRNYRKKCVSSFDDKMENGKIFRIWRSRKSMFPDRFHSSHVSTALKRASIDLLQFKSVRTLIKLYKKLCNDV